MQDLLRVDIEHKLYYEDEFWQVFPLPSLSAPTLHSLGGRCIHTLVAGKVWNLEEFVLLDTLDTPRSAPFIGQ